MIKDPVPSGARRFVDRVCLVTGAAGGIGSAIARRLADEGVRFSTLLDEVRLDMAQRYLSAGRATLTEIAYLLGFSEPNSFYRSLARWTGKTPADFRQTR